MDWMQAEKLLRDNICANLHLTPDANFKIIKEVPPFLCKDYNYAEGFRVQVGEDSEISIPLNMLKIIYHYSIKNDNMYNKSVFKECFPRELNNKPCYVHTVGKLFEKAGVMQSVNRYDYLIKENVKQPEPNENLFNQLLNYLFPRKKLKLSV